MVSERTVILEVTADAFNSAASLSARKSSSRIEKKNMTEFKSWKIPARLREFESGEAPREVLFCIDPEEQAEYRRRWLDGEEIADIRHDIERRKEAEAAAAEVADEPPTKASDRFPELYNGSLPEF